MRRRTFLGNAALLPFTLKSTVLASEHGAKELRAEVVVIGGSTGGCAAASRRRILVAAQKVFYPLPMSGGQFPARRPYSSIR